MTAFKDETGAQVKTGTGASIMIGSGIGSGAVAHAAIDPKRATANIGVSFDIYASI